MWATRLLDESFADLLLSKVEQRGYHGSGWSTQFVELQSRRGTGTKRGGVVSMKTSWQTEADRIVCRWSETGTRVQYSSPWLQEASRSVDRSVAPAVPDFGPSAYDTICFCLP